MSSGFGPILIMFRFASWASRLLLDLARVGMGLVWLGWGGNSWALIKAQPAKISPCATEMLAFLMRMGPNQNPPIENESMRDRNVDLSDVAGFNQRAALKNQSMRNGIANISDAHGLQPKHNL